jgi:hypothetical protein
MSERRDYQVGETVNVEITEALIVDVNADGELHIEHKDATGLHLFPNASCIMITRIAPAAGTPQAGDIWEDAAGHHWFAILHTDRFGGSEVRLTRDGDSTYMAARVHQDYVLVRRLFRIDAAGGADRG